MLISAEVITPEQLSEALAIQKANGGRLGQIFIDHGFITQQQLIDTLRVQLGLDFIDLTKIDIPPEMSKYVPKAVAKKNSIVPVRLSRDTLFLAMEDPLNFFAIEEVRRISKKKIVPMIATGESVTRAINVLYGNEKAAEAMAQMRAEAGFTEAEVTASEPEQSDADAPTARLVNSIIERAYTENASDIHFEPTAGDMVVRMRVDGMLHRTLTIPKDLKDPVISRLKVMSRMNISERRIPQDGAAMVTVQGKDIDMRFSTLPTIYGEKVVLRLLGTDRELLTRSGIGLPDDESRRLDRLLANSSGVILIVGPTGSGKSSTMYTLVQELLNESTNLITLEDPVEYKIDGAAQVQINEKVGLTFASALRSVLRQDPDVICIGEMRDGETAEIAMRAAITGHLVITTLHTEDAVSALDRLHDMGVPPYLTAAGLRGVISQRLLRRVCPHCREEYTPDPGLIELSGVRDLPGRKYYHGKGCEHCFNTGYRGRTGAFELLLIDDALRHCIATDGSKKEFEELAKKTGYITMQENADTLAEQGVTTVEEIIRTIHSGA
jgi:type IV pilus assembly protein PilB